MSKPDKVMFSTAGLIGLGLLVGWLGASLGWCIIASALCAAGIIVLFEGVVDSFVDRIGDREKIQFECACNKYLSNRRGNREIR